MLQTEQIFQHFPQIINLTLPTFIQFSINSKKGHQNFEFCTTNRANFQKKQDGIFNSNNLLQYEQEEIFANS